MQYPPKPWFCRGFTHVWDHRNGVFNTGMGLRGVGHSHCQQILVMLKIPKKRIKKEHLPTPKMVEHTQYPMVMLDSFPSSLAPFVRAPGLGGWE